MPLSFIQITVSITPSKLTEYYFIVLSLSLHPLKDIGVVSKFQLSCKIVINVYILLGHRVKCIYNFIRN